MTTVAILGFGLSGRYLQAPFFLANPNFRLKTIVSNTQNPQDIYPGVQKATSLEAVLADPEIDLVSVASPNETHFAYTQQCLRAGKHVLTEKPFTPTAAEAEELIALAKQVGKHLFVFQNRRWDSDFLTVQKVISEGLIGEVLSYEAHFNRYKPVLNPKKWKETIAPGNGILYDLGAHTLDQAIVLFGKPKSVWGQTFTQREHSEVDDAFDVRLDYGKIKVTLKSSLLVREDTPRYIIQGTKGSFVKYGIDVQEDHLKAGIMPGMPGFGIETEANWATINTEVGGLHLRGRVETLPGNWAPLFQNMHEVISAGQAPLIDMQDIVEQLRVMEAVKVG
ncbi:Gfo/Idh/MocA family oxidoreductase [Haliscomenobacter hydrossis]|uniref:Oxidoreductase domain protein n=1 Tax=Haliscomenobacter hydrossis (strain ATCC 27775 / DSM 1100 / LMG 10767 / O) TaxID=760192 RepID=F4L291_HALH1|nr:Gfo/Idh/MocA family oxidoreductase [Haliscomenobacter hydrossis]AEE51698.1 oxidoreductase domain protein [Haliscomenobacter hydrossis DSM 1100]